MASIKFKKTGGMLGREIESDIDLNEMPAEETQELMRLITETNFFNIPQNLVGHAAPDEYEYTVTVDAGNTHHTIHTSDSNVPDSLRPLIEKLSILANERSSGTQKL